MFKLKRIFHLFLLANAFILTSCAIGPDYKSPEFDLPGSFINTEGFEFSEKIPEDFIWWTNFDDQTLTELIELGALNNLSTKQALARVNQSRALANEAFSELLPGALLNGSYRKAEESGSRFPGATSFRYEVYTGSVDAAWEIDLFGRLRRELEGRNAEYDSLVADLQDAIRIIISEIAGSYIELRAAEAQLNISQNNLNLQKDSYELIKTKFDYGQVNELDLLRAKTELARTSSTIPILKSAIKTHKHRLAVLIACNPTSLYSRLETNNKIPEYAGPLEIVSTEEVLRARPDIRSAERRLAASNARIGVALGELFPKITFTGSLGVDAPSLSQINLDGSFNYFGPSISWAALDTGRLRARVNVADQTTIEALNAYKLAVLTALEDVENSLSKYSADKQKQIQLLIAEDASRKAYSIADDQYREGILDYISVLDSQRTLLQSESEVIEGKKQLALGIINIYKALGGGWHAWNLEEGKLSR